MGTGRIELDRLLMLLQDAAELTTAENRSTVFGEFGIYRGATFRHLCRAARTYGRRAHGFDSFDGMGDPGPNDNGARYPRGRLNNGGLAAFLRTFHEDPSSYRLWEGFVPVCLHKAELGGPKLRFAFAYVDLDHYQPTVDVMTWLGDGRLVPGSVVAFDDYFPGAKMAEAINEWAFSLEDLSVAKYATDNDQAFFWFGERRL